VLAVPSKFTVTVGAVVLPMPPLETATGVVNPTAGVAEFGLVTVIPVPSVIPVSVPLPPLAVDAISTTRLVLSPLTVKVTLVPALNRRLFVVESFVSKDN